MDPSKIDNLQADASLFIRCSVYAKCLAISIPNVTIMSSVVVACPLLVDGVGAGASQREQLHERNPLTVLVLLDLQ